MTALGSQAPKYSTRLGGVGIFLIAILQETRMKATQVDFDILISAIKKTKLEFNDLKIERWGHNDVDDH